MVLFLIIICRTFEPLKVRPIRMERIGTVEQRDTDP